jgi:hypothetical protein
MRCVSGIEGTELFKRWLQEIGKFFRGSVVNEVLNSWGKFLVLVRPCEEGRLVWVLWRSSELCFETTLSGKFACIATLYLANACVM